MHTPLVAKSTPLLLVEAIEPSLPFWCDALGFAASMQVPHGDGLGFVILSLGQVEVMLQTVASLADDVPAYAAHYHNDKTWLFVEVPDLDAVAAALAPYEIVLPRRHTFYGSTEIGYREPSGHFVTFAQFGRDTAAA